MTASNEAPQWAGFRPSRLQAAREAVVEKHPHTRSKLRAASDSKLAEVRRRIEEADGDEEALRRLARELTGAELRGLAGRLGPWDELRGPVATILTERPVPSLFPHLWAVWQRYAGVEELRRLLLDMADRHGWSEVAEGYEEAAEAWIEADRPAIAIQRWLDDQGLSYSDMEELAGLPLRFDAPLTGSVRDAVMTHGSAAQLRSEGPEKLGTWFGELSPQDAKAFGRNYLTTLDVARWQAGLLEMLRDNYGMPRKGRQAFWEDIPDERCEAFHRWFIERNLEEALGAGTDRHRYWKGWSDELVDVELGMAGRTEYAVLYFETFGVIEFFETGNAAYFYPLDELEEVHDSSATNPSALKRKLYPSFQRWTDNRLIHRSPWQGKADRQVENWQRGTG